jgi:nitrogen fixation protein NifU and related proteins
MSQSQLMYREHVLDHYKNPQNYGHLDKPEIIKKEDNPLCGDEVEIEIKLSQDKKIVEDIKFSGHGCAISQAAASMLTENVKGKSIDEIKKIKREDMLELIGVEITTMRLKCALLAWNVIQNALKND